MEKQNYIDAYHKRVAEAMQDPEYLTVGDSHEIICRSGGFTTDEIVGYYLYTYKDEALDMWTKNLNGSRRKWKGLVFPTDKPVTNILTEMFK